MERDDKKLQLSDFNTNPYKSHEIEYNNKPYVVQQIPELLLFIFDLLRFIDFKLFNYCILLGNSKEIQKKLKRN